MSTDATVKRVGNRRGHGSNLRAEILAAMSRVQEGMRHVRSSLRPSDCSPKWARGMP